MFEYALTFTILTVYTIALHFWSDIKELKIDSRRNHMMIGAVLTLGLISNQIFELIFLGFFTIGINLLLSHFEKKQGQVIFGDGDKEILAWSVPGLAIAFTITHSAIFIGILTLSFFGLALLRHFKKISPQKIPGLTIISLAYLIVLIFGWFL